MNDHLTFHTSFHFDASTKTCTYCIHMQDASIDISSDSYGEVLF